MAIAIKMEPGDLREFVPEWCALCRKPTRFWHEPKGVPCCPQCAETHDAVDLPTRDEWRASEDGDRRRRRLGA